MSLNKFKAVIIATVISVIISLCLNYFNVCYSKNWWWSLAFFIPLFTGVNLLNAVKTDAQGASDILMGSIWVKMILLFVAVFIYSLVDKKGMFSFSMHFLTHYILFTVIEIRYLLSKTKKNIK